MSLATSISAAVTKSLLAKLPSEAATKFDLNEDEFKEFLQGFLTGQLGKAAKGGRAGGPKGKNGKGRISGYILFSNENRDSVKESNPDLKFTEVGKKLGEMWGGLSDAEKAQWNSKATAQNEANGLPTPTPSAAGAKGKGGAKAKGASAKAGAKTGAKKAAATPAEGEMKISRHQESKSWVIQGTQFVVQSPKNKVVVGKLRANKVVALSAGDIKKCEESGWEVKPAPAKAAAAKPKAGGRARKAAPPADEDGDDAGSDDDDSDSE